MSPAEALKSVLSKYAVFSGRARRSEYWWFALANFIVGTVLNQIGPKVSSADGTSTAYTSFIVGTVLNQIGPKVSSADGTSTAYTSSVAYVIYSIAVFLPLLAVAVRRMHDVSKSGWYLLMALIPLVGWIFPLIAAIKVGDTGPNSYGPDPKA
jgi:uncharacterized membrane protein YhaH (DUF805 family)